MKTVIADFLAPQSRFSRSANVERDHGADAIAGYLPTGRALDVIGRIARGLSDPAAGRTLSITGPHGGGKSSLALFLSALMSKAATREFKTAHAMLHAVDPALDAALRTGLQDVKAGRTGFARAFATAQNEPVAVTIARALRSVADTGRQSELPNALRSGPQTLSDKQIRDCITQICSHQPMLLVVDEFGKNLEYFAAAGNDGDPYLLQELAELTQGAEAIPLIVITMQHSSFDDYVQQASAARRREWSKVQGRFQDIPYVETPSQSRRLIAASLQVTSSQFSEAAARWVTQHHGQLELLGHGELADDVVAALPLHPLSLAVLPDLCSRYGQNERTLFSFMTGAEPAAVPRLLAATPWTPGDPLPLIGLDKLYDYFLESSANMIGVADGASRWMEIETRIRDSAGLTPTQLKVVKSIGVLNLISSGGRIRASRNMVEFSLLGSDTEQSTDSAIHVDNTLAELIEAGLITYRAFSDEYRIWQGSDYDLRRVIDNARQTCENTDLATLLNDAAPLEPAVAGRHSQRSGILRVLARRFSSVPELAAPRLDPTFDGVVYYCTDPKADWDTSPPSSDGKPTVVAFAHNLLGVRDAAVEAAALTSALRSAEDEGVDWVARRELVERAAAAQQILYVEIGRAWNTDADWQLVPSPELLDAGQGLSALLSDVCDKTYAATPRVANEMIARRELTSQGAKARHFLIDALVSNPEIEAFGIDGYGPERAIYEAIFRSTGMHRAGSDGRWSLNPPSDQAWKNVWTAINQEFDRATDSRRKLLEVAQRLAAPPIGLKDGVIPLLLIAALIAREDEIAVYEHGSLVLSIDDALAERLTKNIAHFTIKNAQTRSGRRKTVLDALIKRLGISSKSAQPTFLNVVTALYRELRVLPPYTQKTQKSLSQDALAVREAFQLASEPDVLVFETLPTILGLSPFVGRARLERGSAEQFAARLAESVLELRGAYPRLLKNIGSQLGGATATHGSLTELREQLSAQATGLDGRVLESRLKAFTSALTRPLDDRSWLENVAMMVSDGRAPRTWADEDTDRFALRVAEVGGAFRRTLALLYDQLASHPEQGFSASRVTLTRPDGSETVDLLAITAHERESIDEHFEPFIDTLVALWGSREAACRLLMARLAVEGEQHRTPTTFEIAREEQRYG